MITLEPVRRVLLPVDSAAAQRLSGPNYDEFQGDREIWELLRENPSSILKVTMAHCDAANLDAILREGSTAALDRAAANTRALIESEETRVIEDALWVYEIASSGGETRQLGIGGMARIGEIRTAENPAGVIIRNEGVRLPKAQGRADLIERTNAFVGVVNNTVEDRDRVLEQALSEVAASREPDLAVEDEHGYRHCVWLLSAPGEIDRFRAILAAEPHAYVADGNHRSAAAGLLGSEQFLSVFFPARSMGIAPYNRLVRTGVPFDEVRSKLEASFEIEDLGDLPGFQPQETHEVGLFAAGRWYLLRPRPSTYDPANAVEVIDADIVQRKFFDEVLGMSDAADDRLTYVGANKDAAYLREQVEAGRARYAVTLPAVTMEQFIEVCRQNRFMPPKSTWFVPKVRSGLVIALID